MGSTEFRSTAILLILLCGLTPIGVPGGGWGLERGRADAADAANLVTDQIAAKRAQRRITEALARPTLAERQAQLTNTDDGFGSARTVERFDNIQDWWLKSVMEPARKVVTNPAASCEEAQVSMQVLLGMMGHRQILGLATEFDELFNEIQTNGYQRCREEALDECLVTGRFTQIIRMAAGQSRDSQLLGGEAASVQWADSALKQCAIYDLEFVSATSTAQIFNLETVRRSKIRLEFNLDNGVLDGLIGGQKLSDLLKGETLGDLLLDSSKCSQPPLNVTCKPGKILSQNFAKVLELDLRHREFYVDGNGLSKERIAGEDKFAFEFGGGMYNVEAVVNVPRYGTVPIPMQAIGYGFYVAHKKDRLSQGGPGIGGSTVKVERNERGVYPILFKFIYADRNTESNATVSDSTEFKLVHKPKPAALPPRKFDEKPDRKPLKPRKPPGEKR